MKLLLDQNISHRVVKTIEPLFAGCQQVRTLGLENSTDKAIWEYAKTNGFTIVTFDSDFYDLSVLYGQPPKLIWLRSGNTSTQNIIELLMKKEKQIKDFLDDEHLTCLEIGQ